MEIGGGGATAEPQTPAAEETQHDLPAAEGGVNPVELLEGHKHADVFRWVYNLDDTTTETSLEPMKLWHETEYGGAAACSQKVGCPMLQIFSLKLTSLPPSSADSPVQLYGFMAVRDPLDPLRNYVFNRSRDDPFVIHDLQSDPFIYLSGPKRGVFMQRYVLLEYDMKVKRGEQHAEHDDLPLVHGVAIFSLPMRSDRAVSNRITGCHGAALEISRSLIANAAQATVQVWVTDLNGGNGRIDLSITASISKVAGEIKVFRGVVDRPCELNRFVFAVGSGCCLFLKFQVPGGSDNYLNLFAFGASAHGFIRDRRELDFATVDVKVTWSSLYDR